MTTVISYYTNDWKYPEFAKQLEKDCHGFGIASYIVEKPSKNSYVGNCQIKPFFIKESLEKFQSPVFWIDADASLMARPKVLFDESMLAYDIAGNHPANSPDRIHVGSIWFNYTPTTMEFVSAWADEVGRKNALDDAAFNGVWTKYQHGLKLMVLPLEYFYIQKNINRPAPLDTVIMHRLSSSDLKLSYKHKVETR